MRKKILILLWGFPVFHRVAPLAIELRDLGHDVRVMASWRGAESNPYPEYEPTICDWHDFDLEGIDEFAPDTILIWNGHFFQIHAAFQHLRKRYRCLILEQGWLPQAGHNYLADGLAQISSIAAIPFESGIASHTDPRLESLREFYKPNGDELAHPEPFIFIPMQLEFDTQIVNTSPEFKTMSATTGYFHHLTKAPVVVKNHPREPNQQRHARVKLYRGELRSIDLCFQAALVAGINSTVLGEALVHYKPVVALGYHVASKAFLPRDPVKAWELSRQGIAGSSLFREMADYRLLVLLENQYPIDNPPGWVIDTVLGDAYRPRVPTKTGSVAALR